MINDRPDPELVTRIEEHMSQGLFLPEYMRQWIAKQVYYFMPRPENFEKISDQILYEMLRKRIAQHVTKRLLAGKPDR